MCVRVRVEDMTRLTDDGNAVDLQTPVVHEPKQVNVDDHLIDLKNETIRCISDSFLNWRYPRFSRLKLPTRKFRAVCAQRTKEAFCTFFHCRVRSD